jgi:hypothetical protein
MSLFPAYVEDDIVEDIEETEETPRDFGVDFATGQLTGTVVEGVEAIKVWCYFALQVARYRFHICSWTYGSDIEELYGKGFSAGYIKSEMKRMIKECLLENPFITSIEVNNAEYAGGRFKANVEITTVYDETDAIEYETEVA